MASIRKRGERWQVQVRREGFPPISKTFDLRSDALKFARAFERDIDRGEVVPAERRQITTTVAELLDRYERTETARKRGAKDEIAHMKAIRRHGISNCNLASLTAASVAGYRDDRLKCVSASTVRREMGILLHCLRLAGREWGMPVQEKAYNTVVRPKEGRARQRRVSFEEIDALLSECDRRSPPYMKPAIILAIETGMRRGELLSLTWADIDRRHDLARLQQTKNGEPRQVPLSPVARRVLRDLPRTGDRIFAVTPNAFRMTWERVKKRANVPDLRFHDLRHEAVSRLFEANLSLPEVALISGHKDPRMLLRYTHLKPEDVARKLGRGRGVEKDHEARREVLRMIERQASSAEFLAEANRLFAADPYVNREMEGLIRQCENRDFGILHDHVEALISKENWSESVLRDGRAPRVGIELEVNQRQNLVARTHGPFHHISFPDDFEAIFYAERRERALRARGEILWFQGYGGLIEYALNQQIAAAIALLGGLQSRLRELMEALGHPLCIVEAAELRFSADHDTLQDVEIHRSGRMQELERRMFTGRV